MDGMQILDLDGIVVRKIPLETISLYAYREGDETRLKWNQSIVMRGERKMIQEIKSNALGGKYLVTFCNGQGSTVIFNIKYDGIGDTIESAYADYLNKKGVA